MYWVGVHMLCVVLVTSSQHTCDTPNSVYRIPGDAIVTGFFGAHSGINCSLIEPAGLQQMQSVISAIEAIRSNNFVPGIHIGLSLYDTCSHEMMAQKSIVSAMVDAECKQEYVIGGLIGEVDPQVEELAHGLQLPLTLVPENFNSTVLIKIAAMVTHKIGWDPVDYILSSEPAFSEEFEAAASSYDICILQKFNLQQLEQIGSNGVVVILARAEEMKTIIPALTNHKVLLVPVNGDYIPSSDGGESSIVVLQATLLSTSAVLSNPYNITEEPTTSVETPESLRSKATIQQVNILYNILKMMANFKSQLSSHCPSNTEWKLCSGVPRGAGPGRGPWADLSEPAPVASALKFLAVPPAEFQAFALFQQVDSSLEKIGSVALDGARWTVNLRFNRSVGAECKEGNETEGMDCSKCSNYRLLIKKSADSEEGLPVVLKDDAWVAALLSVSAVGVLCCFAIAIFILVRVCKKDILEGNPAFSFLTLFSLILMYASVLPFSLNVLDDHHYYSGILCGLRVFCTSLSYALVFSVMLARSLLLASCDRDGGLMSHVNGHLQTTLCFFIALVQVALLVQFWAVNWIVLSGQQCVAMSRGYLFLFLLGYDAFLLVLLLCVSPFVAKSKRNYREGAYFGAASGLCLLVWVAWITAYCVSSPRWADLAVSAGLVGTATAVLVSVFIPRTYLMLSGIVRDHIVSTLPSLAHTASTSIVDVNYRSTQALYDSVHPSRGHVNPNFYAERPNTPSTSRIESRTAHNKTPDNTYERYDTPPSPHNVTRF